MLFALKSPFPLYPFRYFDPVRKRWIRARYVAERHVIESTYAQWEIIGPPEIRPRGGEHDRFNPWSKLAPRPAEVPVKEPPAEEDPPTKEPPANEPPVKEPPPLEPPTLNETERFLVIVFLRRYVTYCARRRRFAQMNGAAKLFRKVMTP